MLVQAGLCWTWSEPKLLFFLCENSNKNPYCLLCISGIPPGQDVMLLSETRQQNTEVRLTLSKVSDKVDQVMQKVGEHMHVSQRKYEP